MHSQCKENIIYNNNPDISDTQNSVHQNQYFPDPLLGVFSYTVNDGSNTFCGAESVWDGCYDTSNSIDRTTVILNYTQCSTTLMGAGKYCRYAIDFNSNLLVI